MAVHAVAGRAPVVSSRRWALFGGIAAAVVVADQVTKAMVAAAVPLGTVVEIVGDAVRIAPGANSGAIFGLFRDRGWLFGLLSVAVLALIVWYHGRSADGGLMVTVALGLLLGGAVGNLIDRFRLGYVLDYVDVGIGPFRWFTFNVADAAISASIALMLLIAFASGRLAAALSR
jgi:signal peptidase II